MRLISDNKSGFDFAAKRYTKTVKEMPSILEDSYLQSTCQREMKYFDSVIPIRENVLRLSLLTMNLLNRPNDGFGLILQVHGMEQRVSSGVVLAVAHVAWFSLSSEGLGKSLMVDAGYVALTGQAILGWSLVSACGVLGLVAGRPPRLGLAGTTARLGGTRRRHRPGPAGRHCVRQLRR